MSESSGTFDLFFDHTAIDLTMMEASIALQSLMGVDIFTSYYADDVVSLKEYKEFCDFTGRIGTMLQLKAAQAQVAVYYPIDLMYRKNIPSSHSITENTDHNLRGFSEAEELCDKNWKMAFSLLFEKKVEFDLIDRKKLLDQEEAFLYEAVLFPGFDETDDELLARMEQLAENGVTVYLQENERPEVMEALIQAQLPHCQMAGEKELAEYFKLGIRREICLSGDDRDVFMQVQSLPEERIIFLVNTAGEERQMLVFVSGGMKAELWNPKDGSMRKVKGEMKAAVPFGGSQMALYPVELSGYEALFLVVTKRPEI